MRWPGLLAVFLVWIGTPACSRRPPQYPAPQTELESEDRPEWFYEQRAYPYGSIPPDARLRSLEQLERMRSGSLPAKEPHRGRGALSATQWTLIGPQPLEHINVFGSPTSAGRIDALAADPADPKVIYAGSAGGGVWKTTDGGITWAPMTDSQPAQDIGALVMDPSNPRVVYAGTGNYYHSAGILKSTDGGLTWTYRLFPTADVVSKRGTRVTALAVHPSNGQVLLAGIDTYFNTRNSGIFRSEDGGLTWVLVLGAGRPATSILFDPVNPALVYAALGGNGVYKSVDGGVRYTQSNGTGPGVLQGEVRRLAIAKSQPAVLYASVHDPAGKNDPIYRTSDGAQTWQRLTDCTAQCSWIDTLAVHPFYPDTVFAGGVWMRRSTDGGKTWTDVSKGPNGVIIHVDHHAIAFAAGGGMLYAGCDGGVWSSFDFGGPSMNWTARNDTLAITEFYPGLSIHPTDPNFGLGGSQDNSVIYYTGSLKWRALWTGDLMWTAFDQDNPMTAYFVLYPNKDMVFKTTDGFRSFRPVSNGMDTARAPWISPLAMDPANSQRLYFGTYQIFQTLDAAANWKSISPDLTGGNGAVTAIAVSGSDPGTLYAASIKYGGRSSVYVTRTALAGGAPDWQPRSAGLPPRQVTRIQVDPANPLTAYATVSGYGPPADRGHVFKTTDGGVSWFDLSGNLPDTPANDLELDPDLPRTFYVATDIGVFRTIDGGISYSPLGAGMPPVPVTGIRLHRPSRILRASTYGRSMWDLKTPTGVPNPLPDLTALSITEVLLDSPGFTLLVNGRNFLFDSVVRINGVDRPTRYINGGQLSVAIAAGELAQVRTLTVSVFNPGPGGGTSTGLALAVKRPIPVLASPGPLNAASLLSGPVAPDELIRIAGDNLVDAKVTVTDSSGAQLPALVVSAAARLIQCVLPSGLTPGAGTLTVSTGASQDAVWQVQIEPVAPGVFSADQTGRGAAAGTITWTRADGSTATQPASAPINPGAEGDEASLQIGGTGFRNRAAGGAVGLRIGGVDADFVDASPSAGSPGVDVLTFHLPGALMKRGVLDAVAIVDGRAANPVTLNFAGAPAVQLKGPRGIAAGMGNVYVADSDNRVVRKIAATGEAAVLVDETAVQLPTGVAVDASGNLYVADFRAGSILLLAPDGTVGTVAAGLAGPYGVSVDPGGSVYVACIGSQSVVKIGADGTVQTVAGSGQAGSGGDGGPATAAQLDRPNAVAFDSKGNLYISTDGDRLIRKVSADDSTISTLTGVTFGLPIGITVDAADNLIVPDSVNGRVVRITPGGVVTTLASQLAGPLAAAFDSFGYLYVIEVSANRIRRINPSGAAAIWPSP